MSYPQYYNDKDRFIVGKLAESVGIKITEVQSEIDDVIWKKACIQVISNMSLLNRASAIKEVISDMSDQEGFSTFASIFRDTYYRNGVDYQVRRICEVFFLLEDGIRLQHIFLDKLRDDINQVYDEMIMI